MCGELFEVPSLVGLKSLRELSIGHCKSWKGVGLHLPVSLKELRISFCTCLEDLPNLSHLRNLEVLKIHHCEGQLVIRGLGGLESLEELEISYCKSLKIFGLRMPINLKRLVVFSCTSLSNIPNLSCLRKLQKLSIHYCDEVLKISCLGEMESLQELSIGPCNSLKKLGRPLPISLKTCYTLTLQMIIDKLSECLSIEGFQSHRIHT